MRGCVINGEPRTSCRRAKARARSAARSPCCRNGPRQPSAGIADGSSGRARRRIDGPRRDCRASAQRQIQRGAIGIPRPTLDGMAQEERHVRAARIDEPRRRRRDPTARRGNALWQMPLALATMDPCLAFRASISWARLPVARSAPHTRPRPFHCWRSSSWLPDSAVSRCRSRFCTASSDAHFGRSSPAFVASPAGSPATAGDRTFRPIVPSTHPRSWNGRRRRDRRRLALRRVPDSPRAARAAAIRDRCIGGIVQLRR